MLPTLPEAMKTMQAVTRKATVNKLRKNPVYCEAMRKGWIDALNGFPYASEYERQRLNWQLGYETGRYAAAACKAVGCPHPKWPASTAIPMSVLAHIRGAGYNV